MLSRQDVKHFFECFCEVVGPKGEHEAWIIQKFPESYKDDSVLKSVPKFAFPCEFDKFVIGNFSFNSKCVLYQEMGMSSFSGLFLSIIPSFLLMLTRNGHSVSVATIQDPKRR